MQNRYSRYRNVLHSKTYPLGYVDLDLFDQNIRDLVSRSKGTPIRLASKSVRCMELILRVLKNPGFRGVMAYRGYEALKLADAGITDILMGYPLSDPNEISAVIERNSPSQKIVLMVDQPAHLELIHGLAKKHGKQVPICIDLDVSTEFFGTHFGVNRSWIKSDQRLAEFLRHLKTCPSLKLIAAMGYEAQIAGVPDIGFKFQLFKKLSVNTLNSRRTAWVKQIEESVGKLEYVNGGGTGSFEATLQDPSVNELTSGSGLYSPGLFDHYKNFKHQPAAGYVLQVVRKPEENIMTCFGGGYIASGGVGLLKAPVIMDPPGMSFFEREGAGEVQTPMIGEAARSFKVGDLVFMRYAKAGEMNERFNELHLISEHEAVRTTPTYRGMGWNFG